MEGIPILREPIAVGAAAGSGMLLASRLEGWEVSPAALLALLNHQLYASTPQEKYATLFLGLYDGASRRITYSNGGHLPPVIMSRDGSIRRLDQGGMVVGLFDNLSFDEASVQLEPGDIFLAYSDGVTSPKMISANSGSKTHRFGPRDRDCPCWKSLSELTAAVDDWIGDQEQPDDITLVPCASALRSLPVDGRKVGAGRTVSIRSPGWIPGALQSLCYPASATSGGNLQCRIVRDRSVKEDRHPN